MLPLSAGPHSTKIAFEWCANVRNGSKATERTMLTDLNSLPKPVFNDVPFKNLAGCLLHGEPTHKSAAAYVAATIVQLAVETEGVKSFRLRFWDNGVTKRYR